MNVSLFVVIDEDNLYRDCVGSVFSETKNHIWLDLGDDRVQFLKQKYKGLINVTVSRSEQSLRQLFLYATNGAG